MDEKSWQKVNEIFLAALELDAESRPKFIAEECAENEDWRKEVESLLATHEEIGDFIEEPAFSFGEVFKENIANQAEKRFGNYKIIKEIGAGGMGVVYLAAREDEQFRRRVAIKLVKRGLDSEDVLQRFRKERQILAGLHHPNIATLLDGGTTSDGLPYFVMEYIEGLPLLKYCDEHRLSVTERLQIFRKICAAVQHAHQNLVIHRDLKPSNILITHDGELKLLDFGVAKFLNPELMGANLDQTQTQFRIMTPEYASPEQFRGGHLNTTSDIYSLGVILYELLTGKRPFRFEGKSLEEIIKTLTTKEPPLPSANLKSEIRNPKSGKSDLDNIVLFALRKEPERRYQSAKAFAEDIERYLEKKPISARADTFFYRTTRFAQRNGVAVLATSLVILAIISGLIVSLWQADVARRERDMATAEKLKAEKINKFLQEMLSFSNQSMTSVSPVAKTKNVTVNEMLDEIAPRVETELADQPEIRARILRTIGSAYASQGIYEKAEKYFRSALETQMTIFGENHAETAETSVQLGVLSLRQTKFAEAGQLLEKAVAFYRKQRAQNSPTYRQANLVTAMDHLGVAKNSIGDVASATSILTEALEIAENADFKGNERYVLAAVQTDLGGVLVLTGKLEQGEKLLRQSLALHKQISETPRWEMGATLVLLGDLEIQRNKLEEAIGFLLESEQIYRRTLGDKNLYLNFNLQRQAIVYRMKKDFKTAEAKARENLAIIKELFPNDETRSALSLVSLGIIIAGDNRCGEAENYLREGLQGLEKFPIKNYLAQVQTKITLSGCLQGKNEFVEAEKIAREASEEATQHLGAENSYTKIAQSKLAEIQAKK